jgi:hypothetical protein
LSRLLPGIRPWNGPRQSSGLAQRDIGPDQSANTVARYSTGHRDLRFPTLSAGNGILSSFLHGTIPAGEQPDLVAVRRARAPQRILTSGAVNDSILVIPAE